MVVLGNSFRYFQRQVASHSLAAVACTPTVQHSQGMDESFECQDELEFLLCLNEEIDDIGEEEPDYQCLTRNVVRCSVLTYEIILNKSSTCNLSLISLFSRGNAMSLFSLGQGIYAIDSGYVRDGLAAIYVIVENGRVAFVETGEIS